MIKKVHYAIGDIHGHDDLLEDLHERISALHKVKHPDKQVCIIHLGDYVDRGPASRQVIDRLIKGHKNFEIICLKGNHEDLLTRCAQKDDSTTWKIWLQNGGDTTLKSFGISPELGQHSAKELTLALGQKRLDWLCSLPLTYEIPGYFFVHAGVKPGVPLSEQVEDDLIWIRSEFLDSQKNHGSIIVHGHTPAKEPEVKHNRINIDTRACYGDKLTAIEINYTDTPNFLQVP